MARRTDLLRLVAANRGRIGWHLLAGWALFAAVFAVGMHDVGDKDSPEPKVETFTALKMHLYCALYALTPWTLFSLNVHQHTGVLAHLPLPRRQINLSLLWHGLATLICCLPMWGFLVWVFPYYGIELKPWLFVFAAACMLLFQVFALRAPLLWRVVVAGAVPLLIFPPHSHETFRNLLVLATTPWASLLLLIVIAVALPWALGAPLPLKARCQ